MDQLKNTPIKVLFDKPLLHWWKGLEEDRASRAILRRCASLDAVAMSAPYQRFYRYMLSSGWSPNASAEQKDKLAAIAGLLAHIETNAGGRLPAAMLQDEKLLVSEVRFRSLLKLDAVDDLFQCIRRILPLMKHSTDISLLAIDLFNWNDEVKKEWAYAYPWPIR